MPKSPTHPSTPRLSEVARHVVIPDGIVTTAWPRIVAKCAEMGVSFDGWQHGIGSIALGKRADGKYAATVGGVVLSIPRQVGKTFLVGMIIIAMCVLFPGLTVLWTAHRTRTATKTFQTIQGMVRRKRIRPHLADTRNDGIRTSNGEQEIRFRNESVILFGAREQGFGRGFDEVDVEVFDEGQILTEKALEDMVPAANQSRQESGALLFFMGTPPRPTDPGDEFTNRRAKALSGAAKNMVYVEFSADPDADLDDHRQWAKANPSFPSRTPVESMERMREQLTEVDSFRREALGIWDEDDSTGFAPLNANWSTGTVSVTPDISTPVVSVDVRTGLEQSFSIAIAGRVDENRDYVDVLQFEWEIRPSREYIVSQVQSWLERRGIESVAIDSFGDGNGPLLPLFEAAGVKVLPLNTTDMRNGCVGFSDAVSNARVLHPANQFLTAAVKGVGVRKSNEGFIFTQAKSSSDITPLRAVTAAWWALQKAAPANYNVLDSFL